MYAEINGKNLYYETAGTKGAPVLFLHGWGGSSQSFGGAFKYLAAKSRRVINPDLPGFGESAAHSAPATVADYAADVAELLRHLGADKVVIVAHSFGARVAARLLECNPALAAGIIITGGAGLKPKRGLKYRFKVWRYKRLKARGGDVSAYGSPDYKRLSGAMRDTFVSVVNTDSAPALQKIRCPCLLVWGRDDRDTPLYMAKRMNKLISGSALILLSGGHYAYVENHAVFCETLWSFISGL